MVPIDYAIRSHRHRFASQKEVQRRYTGVVLNATTPTGGNPDNNVVYWMSAGVIKDKSAGDITIAQAVELGNKSIWLKGRKGKKNATVADIKVTLFEYLRRPVKYWHYKSKEIIGNAFIARICVLMPMGNHPGDGQDQGKRVIQAEDAQSLLRDDTLFKDGFCRDATVAALHRWLEWTVHLHQFYEFPGPTRLHGMHTVYTHTYAFVMTKVRCYSCFSLLRVRQGWRRVCCVLCLPAVQAVTNHLNGSRCSLSISLLYCSGVGAQVYLRLRNIAKHPPFTARAANVDAAFRKVHACVAILVDRYLPVTERHGLNLTLIDGAQADRCTTLGFSESELEETTRQIELARVCPNQEEEGGADHGDAMGVDEHGWSDGLDDDGVPPAPWDPLENEDDEEEEHDQ